MATSSAINNEPVASGANVNPSGSAHGHIKHIWTTNHCALEALGFRIGHGDAVPTPLEQRLFAGSGSGSALFARFFFIGGRACRFGRHTGFNSLLYRLALGGFWIGLLVREHNGRVPRRSRDPAVLRRSARNGQEHSRHLDAPVTTGTLYGPGST